MNLIGNGIVDINAIVLGGNNFDANKIEDLPEGTVGGCLDECRWIFLP